MHTKQRVTTFYTIFPSMKWQLNTMLKVFFCLFFKEPVCFSLSHQWWMKCRTSDSVIQCLIRDQMHKWYACVHLFPPRHNEHTMINIKSTASQSLHSLLSSGFAFIAKIILHFIYGNNCVWVLSVSSLVVGTVICFGSYIYLTAMCLLLLKLNTKRFWFLTQNLKIALQL